MKTTHETRKKFMKEDKKIYLDLVQNERDRNTERHLHELTDSRKISCSSCYKSTTVP